MSRLSLTRRPGEEFTITVPDSSGKKRRIYVRVEKTSTTRAMVSVEADEDVLILRNELTGGRV